MPSLRAHFFRLLLKFAIAPRFRRAGESVPEIRRVVDSLAKYQKMPGGVHVTPARVGDVAGEWVSGPDANEHRVILFLHGGAFVAGSPATHRELAARIALASAARTLVIDYRLAPEHPFPAALDDAIQVYRSLLTEGTLPGQIVIGGDSSGGGLALQTLLRLRDQKRPMPAAAFFLSPQTDWVQFDGDSYTSRANQDPLLTRAQCRFTASCYVGANDPQTPLLSPVSMDLRELPPMLIHSGGHEILLSDAERLAEGAQRAAVEVSFKIWEGMWHVFQSAARSVPESHQALSELGAFLKEHFSRAGPGDHLCRPSDS